jgi:hypothetical protein
MQRGSSSVGVRDGVGGLEEIFIDNFEIDRELPIMGSFIENFTSKGF